MVSRARRSPSPALAALLAALPLGCGAAQVPAPIDDPSPPKTAATNAAAPPSTAAPPEALPPTSEPPSAAPASQKNPRPPSPFHPVVVHGQPTFRMFPLGSFVAAISGDYLSTPVRIDERGARIDGSLYAGLKGLGEQNAFYVMWISGDLPRSGNLGLNLPGERGGEDVYYTWRGSSWSKDPSRPMPNAISSAYYGGGLYSTAPWGDRTLYELNDPNSDESKPTFMLGAGGKSPPVPEIAKGKGKCKTLLLGHADLAVLPSGDLIGLGKVCTEGDEPSFFGQSGAGPLAIERWPKGARTSVIEVLPGSEVAKSILPGARLRVLGPNDVVAITHIADRGPYVAQWNGKTWSDVSPGGSESVADAFRAKDGALWLQRENEMARFSAGKWTTFTPPGGKASLEWAKMAPDETIWVGRPGELLHLDKNGFRVVPLPELAPDEEATPLDVLFREGETLLVARAGGAGTLLSTKKPTKVLDLDTPEAPTEGEPPKPRPATPKVENHAFARITPGSPTCKELFVVLYKLAKVAPPNYDFPLTRAALKGHTELSAVKFAETEESGRRYFVAFVPSFAVGQKLVKAVQEGVKGSTPQMLCGKPARTNRDIRIDLRTGEIVASR